MSLSQTVYFLISNFLYKFTQPSAHCTVRTVSGDSTFRIHHLTSDSHLTVYSVDSHLIVIGIIIAVFSTVRTYNVYKEKGKNYILQLLQCTVYSGEG